MHPDTREPWADAWAARLVEDTQADWEQLAGQLRQLGLEAPSRAAAELSLAGLHAPLSEHIRSLRSTVARAACAATEELGNALSSDEEGGSAHARHHRACQAAALAQALLPSLLAASTQHVQVVRTAALAAATSLLAAATDSLPALSAHLAAAAGDRAAAARLAAALTVETALARWPEGAQAHAAPAVLCWAVLGVCDADPGLRACARRLFANAATRDPAAAEAELDRLGRSDPALSAKLRVMAMEGGSLVRRDDRPRAATAHLVTSARRVLAAGQGQQVPACEGSPPRSPAGGSGGGTPSLGGKENALPLTAPGPRTGKGGAAARRRARRSLGGAALRVALADSRERETAEAGAAEGTPCPVATVQGDPGMRRPGSASCRPWEHVLAVLDTGRPPWRAHCAALEALGEGLSVAPCGRGHAEQAMVALVRGAGDAHARVATSALAALALVIPGPSYLALEPHLDRLVPTLFSRSVDSTTSVRREAGAALAALSGRASREAVAGGVARALAVSRAAKVVLAVTAFLAASPPVLLSHAGPARAMRARLASLAQDRQPELRAGSALALAALDASWAAAGQEAAPPQSEGSSGETSAAVGARDDGRDARGGSVGGEHGTARAPRDRSEGPMASSEAATGAGESESVQVEAWEGIAGAAAPPSSAMTPPPLGPSPGLSPTELSNELLRACTGGVSRRAAAAGLLTAAGEGDSNAARVVLALALEGASLPGTEVPAAAIRELLWHVEKLLAPGAAAAATRAAAAAAAATLDPPRPRSPSSPRPCAPAVRSL